MEFISCSKDCKELELINTVLATNAQCLSSAIGRHACMSGRKTHQDSYGTPLIQEFLVLLTSQTMNPTTSLGYNLNFSRISSEHLHRSATNPPGSVPIHPSSHLRMSYF